MKGIKPAKDKMESIFNLNFTKRELIILNNVLVATPFKVGDVLLILPILEKIRPFIQDTMQAPETNNVVTSTKETPEEKN